LTEEESLGEGGNYQSLEDSIESFHSFTPWLR
jgi:hypothetical protein